MSASASSKNGSHFGSTIPNTEPFRSRYPGGAGVSQAMR